MFVHYLVNEHPGVLEELVARPHTRPRLLRYLLPRTRRSLIIGTAGLDHPLCGSGPGMPGVGFGWSGRAILVCGRVRSPGMMRCNLRGLWLTMTRPRHDDTDRFNPVRGTTPGVNQPLTGD